MMTLWIAQASAAADTSSDGWIVDPERLDPGYAQTMAGGTIQTSFPPPKAPPQPPEWLTALFDAIGRFFDWSAPAFKPLALVAAVLLALFLLYHLVPAFAEWVDRLRFRGRHAADEDAPTVGMAEARAARALLADADALAAEGRFDEAVHLLLYRSVADIEGRRPGLVRPAMTSRELAAAHDLPGVARDAFSRIARAVEISLFGGRSIDGAAWQACRDAYAELTVPKNWARA